MMNFYESTTNAAGRIMEQYPGLVRLFKVYHPALELKVNIEKKNEAPTYHVIERYIDMLLCEGAYTENEIACLLGLNGQAYEVFEWFFQDLIQNGHCEETARGDQKIYRGTELARESVRHRKMYIPGEDLVSRLFDQYTLHLLPRDFYEMGRLEKTEQTVSRDDMQAVWLPKRILSRAGDLPQQVVIGQLLGNHSYSGREQIEEYSLPMGYRGIRLASEGNENPEVRYFPYYLGVFKDSGSENVTYRAFRIDSKKEIPWIGEQYQTREYAEARGLIEHLADVREENLQNPLMDGKEGEPFNSCTIRAGGRVLSVNGYREDRYGNYIWTITDRQVDEMTGILPGSRKDLNLCRWVAYNDQVCLEKFEAGKLIYIQKTDEQEGRLLQALGSH